MLNAVDLDGLERSRKAGSFRDPAGFLFTQDGVLKRAVTSLGQTGYEQLMSSGLYEELAGQGRLVTHTEEPASGAALYKILTPERIHHISYPYEWSFSQLKDAALLTLEVQRTALRHGMSLKDASAFNVQFEGPRPVFIDTLSFEAGTPGPWVAYGQFCAHFLAPLALMAHVSPDLGRLSRLYLDGLPLELASRLLPRPSWLRFGLLIHLHLHARTRRKYARLNQSQVARLRQPVSLARKNALLDSLQSTVENLSLPRVESEWSQYYEEVSRHYSDQAIRFKHAEVLRLTGLVAPREVYDLGGNIGVYSRLLTAQGIRCVCFDLDPLCVDWNYLLSKRDRDAHMLPLVLDLTNPSPALGFDLEEREDWTARSRPDLVLALALMHHLRITGNIPLAKMARSLARLAPALLIEYVPKEDPRARQLIQNRPDTFHDYNYEGFLSAFSVEFELEQSVTLPESERRLCLFRRRT